MKRYRVSNIEAFRQWESDEDMELADLMSRLEWDSESTEAMKAGTALHKALELAPTGIDVSELSDGDYTFCITADLHIGLCSVRELRASKTYMVDGSPITISGQVDALEGLRIEDHKTTSRFDPERYIGGCQWKLYLDIFGAEHFRWNVFEMSAMNEPKTYQVFAQHFLEQYRYPGMERDCQALVERFARFVRTHVEARPVAELQTV